MLSGKPILEFHIEEKYIPSKVLNEQYPYQECVDYFRIIMRIQKNTIYRERFLSLMRINLIGMGTGLMLY